MNSVAELGEVIDGATSVENTKEGEGLILYNGQESLFNVTNHYNNGTQKKCGGDTITLMLAERNAIGKKLTEFERQLRYTVENNGNGGYHVKYRAIANGLEGKIGLHVSLNGREIQGSPFSVNFAILQPLEELKLPLGHNHSLNSSGMKGSPSIMASDKYPWCQISSLPVNRLVSFRLTCGKGTWNTVHFLEFNDSIDQNIFGNNRGRFAITWFRPNNVLFYEGGIQKHTQTGWMPNKVSIELTDHFLHYYGDAELQYSFKVKEGQVYKLIFEGYHEGSSVELLPDIIANI